MATPRPSWCDTSVERTLNTLISGISHGIREPESRWITSPRHHQPQTQANRRDGQSVSVPVCILRSLSRLSSVSSSPLSRHYWGTTERPWRRVVDSPQFVLSWAFFSSDNCTPDGTVLECRFGSRRRRISITPLSGCFNTWLRSGAPAVVEAVELVPNSPAEEPIMQGPMMVVWMVVLSVLVIAPAEEYLFRGVIQRRLRERFNVPGAIFEQACCLDLFTSGISVARLRQHWWER